MILRYKVDGEDRLGLHVLIFTGAIYDEYDSPEGERHDFDYPSRRHLEALIQDRTIHFLDDLTRKYKTIDLV
ncbi:MAG: hypothetical protein H0T62_07260 [Parachlamydiaceae bacterium]|nr:hypothetical protein [Parachlamydiaceae bacterium]